MSTTLAAFLPYVLPFVPGCPEFLINDALVASIQRFYQRTGDVEVELPQIDIVGGQHSYAMTVANAHAYRVISATYAGQSLDPGDPVLFESEIGFDWRQQSGTPTYFYMPGLDQIRLVVTPDAAATGGLMVVCSTYPARTAAAFDDALIEEHRELITNGALSRLMSQNGQKWTDLQQAVMRNGLCEGAIDRHINRVAHGRVRSRKRVAGHYF